MLVLSRKAGEKLIIGNNITVEVVRIQGNRITLGVSAPNDVKILRGELKMLQVTLSDCDSELEPEAEVPMLVQAS